MCLFFYKKLFHLNISIVETSLSSFYLVNYLEPVLFKDKKLSLHIQSHIAQTHVTKSLIFLLN